jgi:hypothetical protein
MTGRTRVRDFLSRGEADRPPFLAMATEFTAKLAQTSVEELVGDPSLFVRSFQESIAVSGFDALMVEVRPEWALPAARGQDPSTDPLVAALREDLGRLRATFGDRLALVALLPGPRTMAPLLEVVPAGDVLEDLVAGALRLHEFLDPTALDAAAVLERTSLSGASVPELSDALATLWNVARYYAVPSLFVAAEGPGNVGEVGATAVTAWSGATPDAVLAGGARAAGVPVANPVALPALPPGRFFTTLDEIPASWPMPAVQRMVRAATTGPPS